MLRGSPQEIFQHLTKGLPKFADGRINFTDVRKAPVLNVVVYYRGEILLLKRSQEVITYRGLWNGVAGFIDRPKPIEAFARQELAEELGIGASDIRRLVVGSLYEVHDKAIDRVWVVYPVLAELAEKPNIKLDWEHTDFAWIQPDQLREYQTVKDFEVSVERALQRL